MVNQTDKFNLDREICRRNTNSHKWDTDSDPDILPMWVADMDFPTAPAITEALLRRASHGIYGYTHLPEEYFESITGWFENRHGWRFTPDDIIPTTGVIPGLTSVIKALTSPGDRIILQSPVYDCFYASTTDNHCQITDIPLIYHGNRYTFDFPSLEKAAGDPKVKLLLLCNPHNPAGRVWSRDELTQLGSICLRHGVKVVADEIHCEFTFPGHKYTPFASISKDFAENSITLCSPSKAFNIAGLQIANIICDSADARERIRKALLVNRHRDVNTFGVEALIAAYTRGGEWRDAVNRYIFNNYRYLREYFKCNIPGIPVTEQEGTYLSWIDCRSLNIPSEQLAAKLLASEKLWLNPGTMYGGEGFLRINMATQLSRMQEGLRRFSRFIANFQN